MTADTPRRNRATWEGQKPLRTPKADAKANSRIQVSPDQAIKPQGDNLGAQGL